VNRKEKTMKFISNEDGAVTVDWVTLVALLIILGLLVLYAIFNNGVNQTVTTINNVLNDSYFQSE